MATTTLKISPDEGECIQCGLCSKSYVGFGNNPYPFKTPRCCDTCNREKVIPARMMLIFYQRNTANKKMKSLKEKKI